MHKEIIIVGAGPVGLTLALMLSKQGKRICILNAGNVQDGRVLALSYASYNMLDALDVWPSEKATPIDIVNISHQGLGASNITNENVKLPHLGFTISYNDLCQRLFNEVSQQQNIEIINAMVTNVVSGKHLSSVSYKNSLDENTTLSCDLAILAEGGKIQLNEIKYQKFDYKQKAIVAHVTLKNIRNKYIAYERFADSGALVLLPYMQHYIAIWALNSKVADNYLKNTIEFIAKLDDAFTNRLGGANIIGKLHSFPLQLQATKQRVLQRVVLLGNSAQTVHPVSAQGLNLGLRDAQALSRILATQNDLKNECKLDSYNKLRNKDSSFVINFTHNLVNLLEQKSTIVKHLRGAGIIGLSNLPPLQNALANSLIFGI